METTYLIENKNFLLKVLKINIKVVEIVQWGPWIISKSTIKLMNSTKNKLNSGKNKLNSKKMLAF